MSPQFLKFINTEIEKPYMVALRSFISEERKTKSVYPAPELVFNHMALCPYDRLKVVVIGSNPFPIDVNDGLAFSVRGYASIEENESIIYDAFKDDFKLCNGVKTMKSKIFPTNQLITWAKQGVLLVNMVQTCTEGNPTAHAGKGWEQFNITLLEWLNDYELPLVFINKSNYDITSHINYRKHLLLGADEKQWCTKANNFIMKRKVPITKQHLQLKINWTTINID